MRSDQLSYAPPEVYFIFIFFNEERAHLCALFLDMVEATRLELATSRSLTVRATGLRYASDLC